jgi:hypothetical protein
MGKAVGRTDLEQLKALYQCLTRGIVGGEKFRVVCPQIEIRDLDISNISV